MLVCSNRWNAALMSLGSLNHGYTKYLKYQIGEIKKECLCLQDDSLLSLDFFLHGKNYVILKLCQSKLNLFYLHRDR